MSLLRLRMLDLYCHCLPDLQGLPAAIVKTSSPDSPQLLGCIRPEESLYKVYCRVVLQAHCVEQPLTSTLGLLAPPFSKDTSASDQRCLFPKLSKMKNHLSACKGVGDWTKMSFALLFLQVACHVNYFISSRAYYVALLFNTLYKHFYCVLYIH